MKTVPILHTDCCTLSAVKQSDVPVLLQILDDSESQRFLPELCEEFQTTESLQQFVASFDKYLLQDEGLLWGIRKDGTLMGFIAIMDIKTNSTLFYAMHPNCRSRGFAKDAVSEVIRYFKKNHPKLNLHTEVYNDNHLSISILQSCGFTVSGKENEKIMLTL